MATKDMHTASAQAVPAPLVHPTFPSPKDIQSVPDISRRHSLPQHFLPSNLWSANTSSTSVVATEEAARGEHILDEATIAHRISALRQLNGSTHTRHRYAKSTGARNSTFSQPVIVRTYSGGPQPRSYQPPKRKQNGTLGIAPTKVDLKLPPVEAFTFNGIMNDIKHEVAEDLERIAEICARSRYSLSNQYEVHMPPHGGGEQHLQGVALAPGSGAAGSGPTLQAIGLDDEHARPATRTRGGRRPRSVAYGTLETIMSSSRSSDEDKSKKKPAAALAKEVTGKATGKGDEASALERTEEEPGGARANHKEGSTVAAIQRPVKHVRSKSAMLATRLIDNAQSTKMNSNTGPVAASSLISEPAQPRTSLAAGLEEQVPPREEQALIRSPTSQTQLPVTVSIGKMSLRSALKPEQKIQPNLLRSLSSWLPWNRPSESLLKPSRALNNKSDAEGTLRELLKPNTNDGKAKAIMR